MRFINAGVLGGKENYDIKNISKVFRLIVLLKTYKKLFEEKKT
jgi:hypothetical protein